MEAPVSVTPKPFYLSTTLIANAALFVLAAIPLISAYLPGSGIVGAETATRIASGLALLGSLLNLGLRYYHTTSPIAGSPSASSRPPAEGSG